MDNIEFSSGIVIHSTRLLYYHDGSVCPESVYLWWNDIASCGVCISSNISDRSLLLSGSISELRQFLHLANRHWKDCDDTYYRYEDEVLMFMIEGMVNIS